MKSTFRTCRVVLSLFLAYFAVVGAGVCYAQSPNKIRQIQPQKMVDEKLFVLRAIDREISKWPMNATPNGLIDRQLRIQRLAEHVQQRGFGEDMNAMLAEIQRAVRAHEDYFVDIGAIDRAALDRQKRERTALGANVTQGVLNGLAQDFTNPPVGSDGKPVGSTTVVVQRVGIGLVAGTLKEFIDQAERDADRKAALDNAKDRFLATFGAIRERVAALARAVARAERWNPGEEGFDGAQVSVALKRRPRDPFLILDDLGTPQPKDDAKELVRCAELAVHAATLVPSGTIYDTYRGDCLRLAAYFANEAASRSWTEGNHQYPAKNANAMVEICRTALAYHSDSAGYGRYDLAMALNFAGQHAESLDTVNSVIQRLGHDSNVTYNYACHLSLNKNAKASLDWLRHTFRMNGESVAWSKKDPDLAHLRESMPNEFRSLTDVRTTFTVNMGIFFDQVSVTNNSAFPVTNYALDLTVSDPSGGYWRKNVFFGTIRPGESRTVDLNGREILARANGWSSRASHGCDQTK